jgi:hypothetical protein
VPRKNGVPKASGVYVFARRFGNSLVPVYIGEAADLRARLRQHLKGSVQLMKALNDAPSGARVFLYCEIKPKKGQDPDKARKILQNALIEHVFANEYLLVNKQGTKVPVHTISFKGSRLSKALAPRRMFYRP